MTASHDPLVLFERHRPLLEAAVAANRARTALTPFVESPSRKHHPPGAHAAGKAAFEARLHAGFELDLPGRCGWVGAEVSPFSGEALGVRYPKIDLSALLRAVQAVASV